MGVDLALGLNVMKVRCSITQKAGWEALNDDRKSALTEHPHTEITKRT